MILSFPCPLAAILPAEPAAFAGAVAGAAALGFTHVEAAALANRSAGHLDALADAGVFVACTMLSGTPAAGTVQARRERLAQLSRQVADAARLGATCAVLTPGAVKGPGGEAVFNEFCTFLAEYAAGRMVRLAVRPASGTHLPDAQAVLAWLERTPENPLGLAVEEDDPALMRQAGARLFHVRLGDRAPSAELAEALAGIGYRGVVSVRLGSPATSQR